MYKVVDYSADEPIMLLDSHIGMDSEDGMGIDGAMFAQSLLELDTMGKKSIQVYVNCPGGNVIDGMAIFNAILKSKTPVDTHNIGIAASMGGVVFMAGRKRIMSDYACLMIHNPSGSDDKAMISAFTESLATMLAGKSGITKLEVTGLMKRTTWLNSAECFAKGFCTDIAVTSEANKKRMSEVVKDPLIPSSQVDNPLLPSSKVADPLLPSSTIQNPVIPSSQVENPVLPSSWVAASNKSARAIYAVSNSITNNLFNTNEINMKQVTAKLGLIEGSNEASHILAIDKITNDAAEALRVEKDKVTKLETELGLTKTKVTELETAAATAKQVTDAAKVTADATAKTELEGKAKTAVTAAVNIGKIKNDATVIAKWEARFVADFAGTTELVNDLPLNRSANTVVNVIGKVEDNAAALKSSGTAAGIMIAIENNLKDKK